MRGVMPVQIHRALVALCLLSALGAPAPALAAGPVSDRPSPVEPRRDPVDGKMWRGDQFYTVPEGAPVEGRQTVRDLRWGFARTAGGAWAVNLARAEIDVRSAHRITLYMSPFEPRKVASHAALLIEFRDPDSIVNRETGARSRGFVISSEARIRPGEQFTFSMGMAGQAPLVHVLGTMEDYRQSLREVWNGEVQRFVLAMEPDEIRATARAALALAISDHRSRRYHLLKASCATSLIDLLNVGLAPDRRIKTSYLGGWIPRPGVSVAGWLPGFLTRHGYVSERLPDLE